MTTGTQQQGGAQNNTDGSGGANGTGQQATALTQGQQGTQGAQGQGQNGGGSNAGGAQASTFDAASLKLPDGWKVNEGLMKDFLPLATGMKLTQEQAQQLVDLQVKGIQSMTEATKTSLTAQLEKSVKENIEKQQDEAYDKQHTAWIESLKTDKVVGGEKYKENMAVAQKAIAKINDPELIQILGHYDAQKNPNGLGLGDHPALVRAFYYFGKSISEDNFGASGGTGGQPVDAATKLYGAGTEVKTGT